MSEKFGKEESERKKKKLYSLGRGKSKVLWSLSLAGKGSADLPC